MPMAVAIAVLTEELWLTAEDNGYGSLYSGPYQRTIYTSRVTAEDNGYGSLYSGPYRRTLVNC